MMDPVSLALSKRYTDQRFRGVYPDRNFYLPKVRGFGQLDLIEESRSASNWQFIPEGDAVGTITDVSEIDTSDFTIEVPESILKPWLYAKDDLWGRVGSNIVKLELQPGGSGYFRFDLPETMDFSGPYELVALMFVDVLSEGAEGNLWLNMYHSADVTSNRRTPVHSQNGYDPAGFWAVVCAPYTTESSETYPRWIGAGPTTPSAITGLGLNVTNTGSVPFRIYTLGFFRAKNPLTKGILMIDFDDGYRSVYDIAFPYMKQRGYNAGMPIIGKRIADGDPTRITAAQMIEMERHGWDMTSHTWDHDRLDLTPPDDLFASIKKNYDWLGEHGCLRGRRFFAPPNNRVSTHGVYYVSLFHQACRGSGPTTGQIPQAIKQWRFPSQGIGGSWSESRWRNLLSIVESKKVIRHVHAHGIADTSYDPFTEDQFKRFIDIISEYDIEVLSWSEVWERYVSPY